MIRAGPGGLVDLFRFRVQCGEGLAASGKGPMATGAPSAYHGVFDVFLILTLGTTVYLGSRGSVVGPWACDGGRD